MNKQAIILKNDGPGRWLCCYYIFNSMVCQSADPHPHRPYTCSVWARARPPPPPKCVLVLPAANFTCRCVCVHNNLSGRYEWPPPQQISSINVGLTPHPHLVLCYYTSNVCVDACVLGQGHTECVADTTAACIASRGEDPYYPEQESVQVPGRISSPGGRVDQRT